MKKWSWTVFIVVFFGLNVFSATILFSPSSRKWVRSQVVSKEQKMLSTVYGDLMHNGSSIKVIKLKSITGIVLEFYSSAENGIRRLVTRIEIPNARDGFFDHRGQAVQLAVADLDGDGKMELLSPTFDERMLAQLNPYHYSAEWEAFVPFIFSDE